MAQTISPSNAAITYVGRWADKVVGGTPSKVIVSGGGNPFRFRFSGQSLGLNWNYTGMGAPVIEYRIDGGDWVSRTLVSGANSLVAGMVMPGPHTCEVWMQGIDIESTRWASPLALQGIVIDDGAALSAYPTDAYGKVLVLGDSIAEGLICTGYNAAPGANNAANDYGRLSFINRVCTSLNLECWNHAFGGSGFNGPFRDVPRTDLNYPYAASGIAKNDPVFDLVFFEIVANDGGMDPTTFRSRYISTINAVKADQPTATIICMTPLDPWSPDLYDDVQYVAAQTDSVLINTSGWSFTHPWANHPDLAGHAAVAEYVKPIVQAYAPSAPPPVAISPIGGLVLRYLTGTVGLSSGGNGALKVKVGGNVYAFPIGGSGPVRVRTSTHPMSLQ